MKANVKTQLSALLQEKKITEVIVWYNTNVCKNYSRARKVVLRLNRKLMDETRYHVKFFKEGRIFHFYVEYYIYGTLVLTKSLIKV